MIIDPQNFSLDAGPCFSVNQKLVKKYTLSETSNLIIQDPVPVGIQIYKNLRFRRQVTKSELLGSFSVREKNLLDGVLSRGADPLVLTVRFFSDPVKGFERTAVERRQPLDGP